MYSCPNERERERERERENRYWSDIEIKRTYNGIEWELMLLLYLVTDSIIVHSNEPDAMNTAGHPHYSTLTIIQN